MGEFDFVVTGDVMRGEWMRRYQAEAEGVHYREATIADLEEISRQSEN